MNKVILCGRLTNDPEIRYTQDQMMIANYTLAVDRFVKDKGADFIRCVAFDKRAQFAEKYLNKGTKIIVSGRIQTGKYDDRNGVTHYTTDIIIDEQEFAESKGSQTESAPETTQAPPQGSAPNDGFMNVDDIDMSDLPFN